MTYIAAVAAAAIAAAAIALGVEGLFAAYPTVSAVETAAVVVAAAAAVAAAAVRFAPLPSHYLVYYKEYCIVVAADAAAVLPVDS